MSDNNATAVGFLGGLLLGATAGFLAGVLIAPASGEETRRRWRRRVEDEASDLRRRGRHLAEDANDLRRKGRRLVNDATEKVEEGLDQGKKTLRKALRR